jgi:hypothetical protein
MMHLDSLTRQRLLRGAAHLHRLGPDAVADFLAEVAGRIGGMPVTIGTLIEYERRPGPAPIRKRRGAARRVAGAPA